MATYNNKHWLLSHIRNSFISTDDTGMCEAVMLSDDLPSKCIELYKKRRDTITKRSTNRPPDEYEWYPGLDQSDDDDLDPLSESYDVQMDQDYGLRKHSAIAQKLERIDQAKRRGGKIKSIKCDDNIPILSEAEATELFQRKTDYQLKNGKEQQQHIQNDSLLAHKLEEMKKQPTNKFQMYSRYDGSQMSVPIKIFKIFLTMLSKEQQNYPMDVCVIGTTKIQEFIGLILYKCSIEYTDVQLNSVESYGLYITEENGEIDDFPPLDLREPCAKFRFSHLALVECKQTEATGGGGVATIRHERQTSMQSEHDIDDSASSSFHNNQDYMSGNNLQDLERMKGHTIMMEAPLYRSYRVKIFTKGIFKTDIQLGISGEKLEIDPVQPQNTKFWSRQKPISHSMESVVWCDIEEHTRSGAIVRIVYSTLTSNDSFSQLNHQQQQSQQHHDNNLTFRHYDFKTNPVTANEIVEKINNIIDVRSSAIRREYLSRFPTTIKKKRISFSFKT